MRAKRAKQLRKLSQANPDITTDRAQRAYYKLIKQQYKEELKQLKNGSTR